MSNKFWCTFLLIICCVNMIHAQEMENVLYGFLSQLNDVRNSPKRLADRIRRDLRRNFANGDDSVNLCLSEDQRWDKDDITTCTYSETTYGGRRQWQAAEADLRDGRNSGGRERLEWSNALSQSCYDLLALQGPAGTTGHTGEDGSTFRERVNRYAESYTGIAETLGYMDEFGDLSWSMMKAMAVDDGVPSLDHRNILFGRDWTNFGVSCGCHSSYTYA